MMGVYKCSNEYNECFIVWAESRGLKDGEPYSSLEYTQWVSPLLYQFERMTGLSGCVPMTERQRAGFIEFLKEGVQGEKERTISD